MSNKKQKEQKEQEKQQKKASDAQKYQEEQDKQSEETSAQEQEAAASGLGVEESGVQQFSSVEETSDQVEESQQRIKELEQENSELKAQYLRKQAEFENFRKRMQKEKQESIKYANNNLLQDLVGIIDDFERAIKSSEESKDFESFHSGIQLIERQLVSMLENKYGLKRMESEGEEFDPQKHEAIAMVESPDHDVQTVVEDYQKGYMINDRVLRHAKVRVAIPANEGSDSEQKEAAEKSGENSKEEEADSSSS